MTVDFRNVNVIHKYGHVMAYQGLNGMACRGLIYSRAGEIVDFCTLQCSYVGPKLL